MKGGDSRTPHSARPDPPDVPDDAPRFAAVDVGSNAARLLLAQVFKDGEGWRVRKSALLRMPVRLGGDVFRTGRISDKRAFQLVETMTGFAHLIRAYDPVDIMACATSAMREAANGPSVRDRILAETGLPLDIIDGQREAAILLENNRREPSGMPPHVLFVDVGGGSTEVTRLHRGRVDSSRSFNIGSIRLSNGLVKDDDWERMQTWLTQTAPDPACLTTIGSGGNIKAIYELAGIPSGRPITRQRIEETARYLDGFTLAERIIRLGLKPDRADVIVPAARIYLNVMEWAGASEMQVPMLGLADGMVHVMYRKFRDGKAGEKT